MEYGIEIFVVVILLAIGIGFLASLFGIGGGFLLVPTMIVFLAMDTHITVGTVAFVIPFMALSSTIAYAKQKRIDYKTTSIILIASVCGAILGAQATALVSGKTILVLFGVVETILAIILGTKKSDAEKEDKRIASEKLGMTEIQSKNKENNQQTEEANDHEDTKNTEEKNEPETKKWYLLKREVVDAEGKMYRFTANLLIAFPLSFLAGFLSSLLGIGGGTLYIQIFVFLCGMSIHMAIASSMFTILITTLSGAITFSLMDQVNYTVGIAYAIGMVIGAQFGAAVNKKISSKYLKPLAALMIAIIAIRMIIFALIQT